eukprot:Pgem_evm1s9780
MFAPQKAYGEQAHPLLISDEAACERAQQFTAGSSNGRQIFWQWIETPESGDEFSCGATEIFNKDFYFDNKNPTQWNINSVGNVNFISKVLNWDNLEVCSFVADYTNTYSCDYSTTDVLNLHCVSNGIVEMNFTRESENDPCFKATWIDDKKEAPNWYAHVDASWLLVDKPPA